MVRVMDRLLKFVTVLTGLGLLAGLGGAWHPAGDSFAVFRVPLLVVIALAVIWTGWPGVLRWPLAALAIAGLAHHAIRALPGPIGDYDLLLYQQNLLTDRQEDADWLAAVAAADPDILTLQEVGNRNLPLLKALEAAYPTQLHCPLGAWLGEAVLSRFPEVPGGRICSARDGVAALQVKTPEGPLWVVSLHVSWPWPHPQMAQLDEILPEISRLGGPMVIAGDFNMVAWGHAVQKVAAATGTRRVGRHAQTFTLPFGLPIGIDHVLATPGIGRGIRVMPGHGSDHRGVLGFLRLARAR
ncbi:endonuclease [Ponticoccus alexandrii]|uniref:Endonuclease n=2 Tax=Ponticoccus alexandrii TaxID=1943633 RepID=A0ABX7F6F4_9RHOB|nr:endonuclease [Ponticoccus alexandrii]